MTQREKLIWSIAQAHRITEPHKWTDHEQLICSVCGGSSTSLLTSCPGYRLNQVALLSIRRGVVKDFVLEKCRRATAK
jgi:hypothetical protein